MTMLPQSPLAELLRRPDTFATTLLTILLDTYPEQTEDGHPLVLQWSPYAIELQLQDDFGVDVPKVNLDKIMAAIAVVTSDGFYKSLPQFISLCNVLGNDDVEPDVFDPADAMEIAWGITEAVLLNPPDESDPEPFTDEIRGYIGAILESQGFLRPPDVLRLGLMKPIELNPDYDFSDDPAMFEAMWSGQDAKTEEVNQAIKEQLQALVSQLRSLKLQHGDSSKIPETLRN